MVGLLLLYVFAVQLGWFPMGGYGTLGASRPAGADARHARRRLVCAHDALVDDRRAAPGLYPHRPRQGPGATRASCSRHALPNAILPIIAMIGIDIGIFMGGVVVVESVFGWPGIGQLAWQAIQRVDIPIIMGVTLVSALRHRARQPARRPRRAVHRPAHQAALRCDKTTREGRLA